MNFLNTVAASYLGRIVLAALLWFLGRKAIQLVLDILERRLSKVRVDQSLRSFLLPLAKVSLQVLLILTVAATLGVEITTFAAIIGAVSFAIGLAFQGSLANFAGGVLILVLKPFRVGDFIEASGFSGTVKEIQVFYTILRTTNNQKIIIPNADLSNSSAINYSAYDTRRTDLRLAVSYQSDLKQAKEAVMKVAENHPLILKDPAPQIVMGDYGPDGAILYIRVWARLADYWTMYFDFLEQIKEAFDRAGVEIPYRQMDVRLKDGLGETIRLETQGGS
ncbi:MAG: mechanosensitive ion channel family protein [Firmicutes bacterium]|nr:mechanosensitive ion channel family protein [Bacillota bacterium]